MNNLHKIMKNRFYFSSNDGCFPMIRFDQLKQYLCTIDKKVVVLLAIVLWLHGVTVGIVFEGQKGLLNRFLWTIVIAFMPMWMVIKSSTWRRTAVF